MTTPFSAADFEQVMRGPQSIVHYRARVPLANPLGPFNIEMNDPPDAELLDHVNRLAAAVSNEFDPILMLIYEHYLSVADDKYWMKGCEVPRRLREDQVMRYVRSRTISVWRHRDRTVASELFISPQWEPEHGLSLGLVSGRFVPLPR